jgi:purine-binding chemotaxis protein CheW
MSVVHGAQLTFVLGDEEYGLPLARVVEIAPDEGLTRVPAAPELLLGVVDVRGVPVPVVDLARKFGVAQRKRGAHRSLIVVESELAGPESLVAIAADQISRVIEPRPEDVEPVPALSSGIRVEFLRGMVKSDRGFVLLLDMELVLSATEQEALSGAVAPRAAEAAAAPNAPRASRRAEAAAPAAEGARRFVVVRSGGVQCGVDAAWVQEVTPAGGVTGVPGSPASFHGLHNLRGSVVPVLDLGAVMGQAPFTPRERSAFLVLDAPGGATRGVAALAVEAVMGMVEVGAGEIDAVPSFTSQAPAELVEGASLSLGKPTLILDLKALFAR